jgi:hypothetical protein
MDGGHNDAPLRRKIMSARCVLTLLVVVVLSLLLLMYGPALARPVTGPLDASGRAGLHVKGGADPDDVNPDGVITTGDDDNWDRPVPGEPHCADALASAGRQWSVVPDRDPEPLEVKFALHPWLFFRAWAVILVWHPGT